jgi:predicted ribosome quality control (RQC) complex YloA/Tae2 family protein
MSLDTFTLQAIIDECVDLAGAKIVAIEQYDAAEIGLVLRGSAGRAALAISVQSGFARIYRTAPSRPGAGSSALLTVLRDHLLAGTLDRLEAAPNERIALLHCTGRTPLGPRTYRLIAELIDRHTTLVLVTEPDRIILETLRRIRTGERALLPGERYEYPEPLKKTPLPEATPDLLAEAAGAGDPDRMVRALTRSIGGLSPRIAQEIAAGAGLADPEAFARYPDEERLRRLWAGVSETAERVRNKRWTPAIGRNAAGRPVLLSALPVYSLPPAQVERFASMSAAIERFYAERLEEERQRQREARVRRALDEEVKRLERLMDNLWQDAAVTDREEEFRKCGELLMGHLTQLKRGQTEAAVRDYYAPDHPLIAIPLHPELTPAENAERYFKQARKARDGRVVVEERLAQTEERLHRVRAVRDGLGEGPDPEGVERAHRACVRLGLIKESRPAPRTAAAKKRKAAEIHPRRFVTTDGYLVLVGRNNRENELLTKSAAPDDIWLHARDMGGSHVILRREGRKDMPSRQAIHEAACVAAHFSKGRTSTTVPVDYTERRYVRKQKNGGPGQVIFTHERTLFVEPRLALREAEEKEDTPSPDV